MSPSLKRFKKNKIKPHLSRYWAIPPDHSSRFVAKMEDVLEVYSRPYDQSRPVICMDEKPLQLLGESRPRFRCTDASMVVDCEYVRNGTCSIFMFVEPLTGWMRPEVLEHRTKVDWAHQMKKLIDEDYPDAERIILVMDNLNTHNIASFYDAFPPAEARRLASKLEIHYTPEHGSWLDIAEVALSVLSHECLGNRRFETIDILDRELEAWKIRHNANRKKVDWQFTTAKARTKLKHLYPDLNSVLE